MRISLVKTFGFEAAHWLPCFPEGHKCRRMHGHSFKVDVMIEGDVPPEQGYLVDFADVKKAIQPIENELDHYCLNDIQGLEVPTAENLSKWIYDRLKPALPMLCMVRVRETCTSAAEYRGE